MTQAYPLHWPAGRPRTAPLYRKNGQFGTKKYRSGSSWASKEPLSISEAVKRLQDECDRIGASYLVLSTNVETRLDGFPRSDRRQPDDPGVALYFLHKKAQIVLACDTFRLVADNIAAIAAHIEATRAIERYGVGTASEMFSGFVALPGPMTTPMMWWQTLGVAEGAPLDECEAAYRTRAKRAHPDAGGSAEGMARLNAAIAEARRIKG